MLCSKARNGDALDPRMARQTPGNVIPPLGAKELQYYTSDVHSAAFVIPKFAIDAIGEHLTFQK
jgi:spermidine synthase